MTSNVPFRIRIGVTGHRKLTDEQFRFIRERVKVALKRFDEKITLLIQQNKLTQTPYTFLAVSPLAEGADWRPIANAWQGKK